MRNMMMVLFLPALAGMCQETPKVAEPQVAKSYVLMNDAKEKSDPFLNDVAAFLETNTVVYLATFDGQSPRVRPVRYTVMMDNKIVIATSTKKELSRQISKTPNVEISVTAADSSAFLRYKGKAVVCEDARMKAKFLSDFPKFKKMFGDNLVVYLIEPEMAGIFPMKKGEPPKTKVFAK